MNSSRGFDRGRSRQPHRDDSRGRGSSSSKPRWTPPQRVRVTVDLPEPGCRRPESRWPVDCTVGSREVRRVLRSGYQPRRPADAAGGCSLRCRFAVRCGSASDGRHHWSRDCRSSDRDVEFQQRFSALRQLPEHRSRLSNLTRMARKVVGPSSSSVGWTATRTDRSARKSGNRANQPG